MKKYLRNIFSGSLLLICCTIISYGQDNNKPETHKIPAWVSEMGFWVVESNVNSPLNSTIFFYTNDETLVYTKHLQGVKLNLHKRKTKIKLKKALETSILAWNERRPENENEQILASILTFK